MQHLVENNPESTVIEKEEVEKILGLIHKHLPKKEALAMLLRYGKDGDSIEVAETMGVKAATVNKYVCLGVKKIRRIIAAEKAGNYDCT